MEQLLLSLLSYVSHQFVVICIACTPLTHLAGVLYYGLPHVRGLRTRGSRLLQFLAFPFSGGYRHMVFQLFGWSLWAGSALASLPVWLSGPLRTLCHLPPPLVVPDTHVDVISGAAATSSFIAQLFMLQAMLVYEPATQQLARSSSGGGGGSGNSFSAGVGVDAALAGGSALIHGAVKRGKEQWRRLSGDFSSSSALSGIPSGLRRTLSSSMGGIPLPARPSRARQLLTRHGAAVAVILMGVLLSVTGVLLLLSVEHMPDIPSRVLYCCLSLVCLTVGALSTHGLGGYLRWGNGQQPWDQQDARLQSPAKPKRGGRRQRASSHGGSSAPGGGTATVVAPVGMDDGQYGAAGLQDAPAGAVEVAAAAAQFEDSDSENESSWAFFQPFAGGTVFIATQAVGWSLFAVTVVMIVVLARAAVEGVVRYLRVWVLGTGVLMVTSQAVLAISLMTWRARATNARWQREHPLQRQQPPSSWSMPQVLQRIFVFGTTASRKRTKAQLLSQQTLRKQQQAAVRPAAAATAVASFAAAVHKAWIAGGVLGVMNAGRAAVQAFLDLHGPMVVMFLPVQMFFTCWALTFAFCPTHYAVLGWLVCMPLLFVSTIKGEAQHTGERIWPALRAWMTKNAERSLTWWFGKVEVIADWEGPAPHVQHDKQIFGFHPHGLYPTGAGFLPMLPSFQRLLPTVRPITLTASVMYYVPAIKDLSLWMGFRQITRRTFLRALKDVGSVMVCPGGQAELVYAYHSHDRRSRITNTRIMQRAQAASFAAAAAAATSSSDGHVSSAVAVASKDKSAVSSCAGQEGLAGNVAYAAASCTAAAPAGADGLVDGSNANTITTIHETAEATASRAVSSDVGEPADCVAAASIKSDDEGTTPDSAVATCSVVNGHVSSAAAAGGEAEHAAANGLKHRRPRKRAGTAAATAAMNAGKVAVEDLFGSGSVHNVHVEAGSTAGSTTDSTAEAAAPEAAAPPAPAAKQHVEAAEGGDGAAVLVIYAGHKGFVRIACEQQAALVPVLALGEVLQLHNLIRWPSMQRWTYKRLGFPMPFILSGRWAVTQFPRRTPLVYVIGKPIQPPPLPADGVVPQSMVDDLHHQFYSALQDMYHRHAHRHPEFKNAKLVMLYNHTNDLSS